MLSSFEWTEKLNALGAGRGLAVYDLELPQGRSGKFRVFLWKAEDSERQQQVSLEECIQFARAMRTLPELRLLEEAGAGLEVSSPGINRSLRTAEHFLSAQGEHIAVKVYDPKGSRWVKGELVDFCRESSRLNLRASDNLEQAGVSKGGKKKKKPSSKKARKSASGAQDEGAVLSRPDVDVDSQDLASEGQKSHDGAPMNIALEDVVEARVEYLF